MKQILTFETKLTKQEIIKLLRETTFPTEFDFQTLLYGKEYFSGQVNGDKIKIKNAFRRPDRDPSPILEITTISNPESTTVVIYDNSENNIFLDTSIYLVVSISMSVVVFLVGGVISISQSQFQPILFSIAIALLISSFGLLNKLLYKKRIRSNQNDDVEFLLKLLTR